ncbi:MAG TPA: glycosyltransferase, partial [Gemmatimonadales bacterium]|nr:glycosyltransferase [Gemmatimonadales bacterium]
QRFPSVRVVSMPGNLGAAAARNAALAEAGTDLVLLIDNDVALTPGSLDLLLAAVRGDERVVAVMPAIIYGGGSTVQYDGAETHFLGQQTLQHENVPYESLPRAERSLGSLISACLLVDRSRLPEGAPGGDRLAAFDEDFFIYFEDHDFGFRMRAMGLDVRAVPEAFCYHGVGTPGISIRALGKYSPLRIVCHIRNRWLFILKNYSARSLVLLSPVLLLYELVQFAAILKKGWLGHWMIAAGWVLRHPGTWYAKRRRVQRGRRVSDGELLHGGPVPLRDEAVASPVERTAKKILDGVTGAYWQVVRGLL